MLFWWWWPVLYRMMIPVAQTLIWRRRWTRRKEAWGCTITMEIWGREEGEEGGCVIVHLFPKRHQGLVRLGPTMTRWCLSASSAVLVSYVFHMSRWHFVLSHFSLFPLVDLLCRLGPPHFFLSSTCPTPSSSPLKLVSIGCHCDRPFLWPIRIGALGRRVLALCIHHPLSTSPIPSSTTLFPLDK